MHNQPKSAHLCGATFFSKMPHFHRINHWFPRNFFFVAKKLILQKVQKCCIYFTVEQPFSSCCHGNVMKRHHRKAANPVKKTLSPQITHLPTKISAKDRAKHFPSVLHDSEGKLFCTPCNCVLDRRRKSTLDNHFATPNNRGWSKLQRKQPRSSSPTPRRQLPKQGFQGWKNQGQCVYVVCGCNLALGSDSQ